MRDWRGPVRQRLDGLGLEPTRVDEIVEELGQHLEDRYRELRSAGTTEQEAERIVLDELAAADVLRDAIRSVERAVDVEPAVLGGGRGGGWLKGWGSDVRYGLRTLRRSPGLTATVVLTLALGIGSNAAIFSVVHAVLLRPLPFTDPARLVAFWGSAPEKGLPVVSFPDALYVYFRTRSRTLQPIAAYDSGGFTLAVAGEPERIEGAAVTADFFRLLGRVPLHGRTFLPEEEADGRNHVAVLGYGLWQRRFGGDPGIIGRSVNLSGLQGTVVGVMPPGFDFPARSQVWVPRGTDPRAVDCWCYSTMGRLAPGLKPEDAAREIAALNDDFWRERNPGAPPGPKSVVVAVPLTRELVKDVRTPLVVLLGAVGMVLLIACANVANLLLARSGARGREIALRCCLGASPWRIVRQLLVESVLLAATGAALGLLLAAWAVKALERLAVEHLTFVERVALDRTVLLFTLALTVATAALFGLAPALRGARVDVQAALKEGARGTAGASTRRVSNGFVVAQFALSLVLLVGAGLLLRSFRNLMAVDPGFRTENVIVGRVSLPYEQYREPARMRRFYQTLAERAAALPGVRSAGLSSTAPFSQGNQQQEFVVKGHEPAPEQAIPVVSLRVVTTGYFASIGTPLRRGRLFADTDTEAAPPVAIVDESLARRYWPDGNALGQQVRLGNLTSDNPWLTIVGVVASIKHGNLDRPPDHYIYRPLLQSGDWRMDLVVRTTAEPAALVPALRAEVRALDATLPMHDVHTLEEAVARSLGPRRLTNVLLLAFAAAALLLAGIGIYGVMALSVTQRVNEFGVRLALGAAPRQVLALVLRQGMSLVLLGTALGLAGAFAFSRYLDALLYQVQPTDPVVFVLVAVVLAAVALAACYIPARRATATDPLQALRYE
jgi:predicted permease